MKTLLETVKGLPFTVKAALLVLSLVWALAFITFPVALTVITCIILTVASLVRVINYFIDGE